MATHVPPPVGEISAISHFAAVAREPQPGRQLDLIRRGGTRVSSVVPDARGCPTGSAPSTSCRCPIRRDSVSFERRSAPAPYLSLTHRLVVVRWREPDGKSQGAALRADRRRARPAHAVFRAAQRVDTCRIRARVRASARRRDEPSAQRRHRRRRRRLDHVRPSAHAGRASMDRHHRARARPLAGGSDRARAARTRA